MSSEILKAQNSSTKPVYSLSNNSNTSFKHSRKWRNWKSRWDISSFDEYGSFKLRYNRVEGLFLGLGFPGAGWWDDYGSGINLIGHVGYGFKSEAWRYKLGLERNFFDEIGFGLGAEIHDLTDTQDEWVIPSFENSLAAFFLHEDFQDFYRREGWSGYFKQNTYDTFMLKIGYHYDRYFNMEKKNDWALFGGSKHFLPNPEIDEGKIRSIKALLTIDSRDYARAPEQGWYVSLFGEAAGYNLESDYDFYRVIIDFRRYQPIGWDENLDIRLRVGSATGDLPRQFLFDLGGLSTLRGFNFKEFTGNRMILANIEYRIEPDRGAFPDLWLFEHTNIILFVDSGLSWFALDNSDLTTSFDDLGWSDLKTNIGFALSDSEGRLRLNFAKRTDIGGQPLVVTLRLNRAF